jgi:hypothetical protein
MSRAATIIATTLAGVFLLSFAAHELFYGGLLVPLHVAVTKGPLQPFATRGCAFLLLGNTFIGGGAAFYLHCRLLEKRSASETPRWVLLKELASTGAVIFNIGYAFLHYPLGWWLFGPEGSQDPRVVLGQNLGLTLVFMGGCLASMTAPSRARWPAPRSPQPQWSKGKKIALALSVAAICAQLAVYALVAPSAVFLTLPLAAGLFALTPHKAPAGGQLPRARRLLVKAALIVTVASALIWIAPFSEPTAAIYRILSLDLTAILWPAVFRLGIGKAEGAGR